MMKTLIAFFVFTISVTNMFSQENNIWTEVIGYLEAQEQFDKLERGNIYAYELLKDMELTDNAQDGIYRIGVFASHTFTHLMLLNNGKPIFLDNVSDLAKTLNELLAFFNNIGTKISDHEKLHYIKEVLYWHESNKNRIPW